jgi:hypothetical protein
MRLSSALSSSFECPYPSRSRRSVTSIVAAAEKVLRVELPDLMRDVELPSKGRDRAAAATLFERRKLRMLTFSKGELNKPSFVMLHFVNWLNTMRFSFVMPASRARADAENVLRALGDAAGAWWGITSTAGLIRFDSRLWPDPVAKRQYRPKGFPELLPVGYADSPKRPPYIGWINYWSREAARLAGDEGGGAVLRDLDQGAKLLRVTQPALDPKKKAHLSKLQAAYAQFPGVGRIQPVKG